MFCIRILPCTIPLRPARWAAQFAVCALWSAGISLGASAQESAGLPSDPIVRTAPLEIPDLEAPLESPSTTGSAAPVGVPAAQRSGPVAPVVPLDRLLSIPGEAVVTPVEAGRRGGATKAEWQTRFTEVREELATAEAALADTRAKLEQSSAVSGAWRMTAPGFGANENSDTGETVPVDAPLDYKLSQALRRQREDLERAERKLGELEVEANLAGVPEDWRAAEGDPADGVE